MNVLSLFDWMWCWYLALQRAGIKVDNYYASEIDKYSISIAKKNNPDIIHLWDINNRKNWILPKIDLIIWWSPCQGFSNAGVKKNFLDDRSKLFFTFAEVVAHYNPTNFLLENVRMKQEWRDIISNHLFWVEEVFINSALVSAQDRKRLYRSRQKQWKWIYLTHNIPQPQDKEIYLKDILESGEVDRDKSFCIDAHYYKGGNLKQYFKKSRRQLVFNKAERVWIIGKWWQWQRVYNTDGKSVSLSALWWGRWAKTWLYFIKQRARGYNKWGKHYKKSPPITACSRQENNKLSNGYVIRKLTPIECERLQTLPDNYTEGVSNTQRYKMIGNGWTVDVITHILNHMQLKWN